MFKYIFTFFGILIGGTALAAGDILSAVIIFAFFTLLGKGIDKLIGGDDNDTVEKNSADVATVTNTSENIEETEDNSDTTDKEMLDEKIEDWICPNCGNSNNGNFCEECGTKRPEEKVCKKCGAKLEDDQKYCEECGTKIE